MNPQEVAVIPSTIRLAILTSQLATGGAFYQPTVLLYKNNIVLEPSLGFAAFTVADYDGYANVVAMGWNAPYIDVDGSALVFGDSITIPCTGATVPNTIYGYIAANSGLTVLKAAWRFNTPQGISAAGQAVSFVPALRYSGT